MTQSKNDYYVYVYIDPRNFEEFYYGKGRGSRKLAHKGEADSDSLKRKRIADIEKEGLKPVIRVIAAGLVEHEAFLIEKTLIWKLGRQLTNKSTGHFADKFRPQNTFHKNISGFDFEGGIFYVNVGEGRHRNWADCHRFGFLSAGQGAKWSRQIRTLNANDIVVAFLKGHGYVGIGRVISEAIRIKDFHLNAKLLRHHDLKCPNIFENCDDSEKTEYAVAVKWLRAVDGAGAKWKPRYNLFSSRSIKASLATQFRTLEYLEENFDVKFSELLM